jgi:hypothetical protein
MPNDPNTVQALAERARRAWAINPPSVVVLAEEMRAIEVGLRALIEQLQRTPGEGELTDAQIEEVAARIASQSLNATRVHELGGKTRTIFDPAGLIEFARALLSHPAAVQPKEVRMLTENEVRTLHTSMVGRSPRDLPQAIQRTFAAVNGLTLKGE